MPATITVTSLSDFAIGTQHNGVTLRDAIEAANTDTSVNGSTAGTSGANTIVFAPSLAGGTITLTQTGDGTAGPSALDVTSNITIDGLTGTSGVTISGGGSSSDLRLFFVASTGNLTLENLTLSNGRALGGSSNQGGGAAGLGGAVFVEQGSLTVLNSTLIDNIAQGGSGGVSTLGQGGGGLGGDGNGVDGGGPNGGSGIAGNGYAGGGGFGGGGGGVNDISPSSAGYAGSGGFGGGGGGAAIYGAPDGGGFGGGGGAVYGGAGAGGFGGGNGNGSAVSVQGGGGAGMGGAIFSNGGTVVITDSTLAGNAALGGTGGYAGQGLGGAVFNRDGSLTITASTLSANVADGGGRQVFAIGDINHGGSDPVTSGTATTTITDSILAQSDTNVTDFLGQSWNGGTSTTSGTNDLVGSSYGFNGGAVSSADPLLGSLGNHGGPTPTLPLLAGSPAIAAGVAVSGVTTDQRGMPRQATPDIGAYELRSPVVTVTDGGTYNGSPFAATATVAGLMAGVDTTPGPTLEGVGLTFDYVNTDTNTDLGSTAPTNAGDYRVTASFAGSTSYAAASASTTFTIAQAPLSVAADTLSKTVGSSDPALTYTVTAGSLAQGDSFSGALTRVPGETVGSYDIQQGTLTAGPNYDLSFTGGVLYITASAAPVVNAQTVPVSSTGGTSTATTANGPTDTSPAVKAQGSGYDGTLTAVKFKTSPASLNDPTTSTYYDVRATGTNLDTGQVVLTFSNQTPGKTVSWWDGTRWRALRNSSTELVQTDANGNASVTLTSTTALSIKNLLGQYFQVGPTPEAPSLEVTTASDVSNSFDGLTSLPEAIAYANSLGGPQTITFAPSLAGQTIDLTTIGDSVDSGASALAITGDVTIDGSTAPGLSIARSTASGTPDFRIFYVSQTASLTLNDLTVSGGVDNSQNGGGGVENFGTATLTNVTIANNSVSTTGGGLENFGTATLTNVTIANNSVSTTAASYSGQGGGVYNVGTATLTDVTIANNSAANAGGGLWDSGTATLTNVTIANNSVSTSGYEPGGGILNDTGQVTLYNSIVAGNSPSDIENSLGSSTGVTGSNNLIGGGGGGLTNGTDGNIVGQSIPLSSIFVMTTGANPVPLLADNGGLTQTIALAAGSRAIDAGSASVPGYVNTDQRGALRGTAGLNAGSAPDIGAYEASSSFLVTNTADNGAGSLRDAVQWANVSTNVNAANLAPNTPAPNTITFAPSLAGQTIDLTTIGDSVDSGASALAITGDVTIDGSTAPGLTIARNNGAPQFRIFYANGRFALNDLTVTGGYDSSGFGGGGLLAHGGTVTLVGDTITDNSTTEDGGGVLIDAGATVLMINDTFANNSAFGGGGLYCGNATSGGSVTLSDDTLTRNSAVVAVGGGISVNGTGVTLNNTIVAGNSSDIFGAVTGSNNLIGDPNSAGGLTNGTDGNIVGQNGNAIPLSSIFVMTTGANPVPLLADNGGLTQTIALAAGSPAIDAGSASVPGYVNTDQRGALRGTAGLNAGSAPDIGAYEASSSFLVTNTADSGAGSLRDAVQWANVSTNVNAANLAPNTPAPNTITFAPSLAGQTIDLTTIGDSVDFGASALAITGDVTIDGSTAPGLTIARDVAAADFRLFYVNTAASLVLYGVTLSDGVDASGNGGGAVLNEGTVALTDATLAGNTGSGGGLFNDYGGVATLTDVSFTGNSTGGPGGGGALTNLGTASLTDVTVANNSAGTEGGGILNIGTSTITDSTIFNNSAPYGGGLKNNGAVTLTNVTVANNSAAQVGGGLDNQATAALNNTIVAGNSITGSSYAASPNEIAGTVTGSNNLIGDPNSAGGLTNGIDGNIVGQNGNPIPPSSIFAVNANGNPVLGAYGGTTGVQAVALVPGSPAIDAGSTALAVDANGKRLTTDARGLPRVVGSAVDIGAFESQGFTVQASGGNNQATPINTAFGQPLTVTVTANNPAEPVAGGTVTFSVPGTGASAALGNTTAVIGSDGTASVNATANGTIGQYDVTAGASGVATPAQFSFGNEETPSLVVTTLQDVADPYDGQTSLREAIAYAGTLGGQETVTFAPGLSGTIHLTTIGDRLAGGSAFGIGGTLNLTIDAGGRAITLDGGGLNSRAFEIEYAATLTLKGLTIVDFSTGWAGGAILNFGTVTLIGDTFADNFSPQGGAVDNDNIATLIDDTFVGNRANRGGGLYNVNGTASLTNDTFTGNSAMNGTGAGLDSAGGTTTLNNTIVAGNFWTNRSYASNPSEIAGGVTGSNNLIGDPNSAGGLTNGTDGNIVGAGGSPIPLSAIFAVDANGNPVLANYGGPTDTVALVPGSPAIDAGSNALAVDANRNPLTTDQRGLARIVNGTVDIGAFESQGFTLGISGGNNQSAVTGQPFTTPLSVTITANNPVEPVNGGTVTFTAPGSGASALLVPVQATISDGAASVDATANAVGGAYQVVASAAGTNAVAFDMTNNWQPAFTGLTASQAITYGTPSVTLGGTLAAGATPATGTVQLTIAGNGITPITGPATIQSDGYFSTTIDTTALPATPGLAYTITYKYAGQGYFLSALDRSTTLTVNRATPTVNVTDGGGTYNGSADPAVATVAGLSGVAQSSLESVDPTVQYDQLVNGSYTSIGTAAPVHAGRYEAIATFPGSADYGQASDTVAFTIAPRTLTASIVGDPTKTYDGTPNASLTPADFSLANIVAGESFTVTQTLGAYNSSHVTDANTVTTTLSAGDFTPVGATLASDYTLPSSAAGAGQITPYAFAYNIGNDAQTYGAPANLAADLGTTILIGVNGENLNIVYASNGDNATASVGGYDITGTLASGTGELSDYAPTLTPGTLTVNPAPLYVTANANSKVYGQTAVDSGTISGVLNNDGITATFSSLGDAPEAPVSGSPYTISATLSDPNNKLGNYTVHSTTALLTVNPTQPTLGIGAGAPAVVGTGQALTASATLAGGYNETGTITFTLYAPDGSAAYTDTVTVSGNGTYLSSGAGTTTGSAVPTMAGTYQWSATYSGDGNNDGANGTPNSAPEIAVGPGVTVVGTTLYLVGGATNDSISITPAGASDTGSTGLIVNANLDHIDVDRQLYTQAFTAIDVVGFGGNDTLSVAPRITIATTVSEEDGNDALKLGDGNNTVTVGNGNDAIQAGDGNNTITGGNGNDTVVLGNGNNSVTLGGPSAQHPGPGPDDPGGVLPPDGGPGRGRGAGDFQPGDGLDGPGMLGQNDVVVVGNGANTVTLGDGNDRVQAGNGNNTVTVGNGDDLIQAGVGNNTITGGNGNDAVVLGNGNGPPGGRSAQHIGPGPDGPGGALPPGDGPGGPGRGDGEGDGGTRGTTDTDVPDNGANTVTLGNGNDRIQAGDGNNVITVGSGNDIIQVGNGNNVVSAGGGNDTIIAGDGDNLIVGGAGHNTIIVGDGSNILIDGSVQLTQPGDTLTQVLDGWIASGAASSDVASIRSRLSVTYNTQNRNTLIAGNGLDWFWFTNSNDHTNRKPTDLLN